MLFSEHKGPKKQVFGITYHKKQLTYSFGEHNDQLYLVWLS